MTAPEHGARWSGQWQDDQIAKASRDRFVMPPPVQTIQSRCADLAARIVLVTALTTWTVGTIIKVVFG